MSRPESHLWMSWHSPTNVMPSPMVRDFTIGNHCTSKKISALTSFLPRKQPSEEMDERCTGGTSCLAKHSRLNRWKWFGLGHLQRFFRVGPHTSLTMKLEDPCPSWTRVGTYPWIIMGFRDLQGPILLELENLDQSYPSAHLAPTTSLFCGSTGSQCNSERHFLSGPDVATPHEIFQPNCTPGIKSS